MEILNSYLTKYRNLVPPEASKVRVICQVIKDECGITLPEGAVSVRRGGVFTTCHPAIKSELMRCAPQILTKLHSDYQVRVTFIR